MDQQNNILGTVNQTGSVAPTQPSPSPTNPQAAKKSSKGLIIAIVIIVFVLLTGIGGFLLIGDQFLTARKSVSTTKSTTPVTTDSEESANQLGRDLESLYSSLETTYAGSIPWNNLNNREAYQFFPNEIKGFPLVIGKIATIVDIDYNPITVFDLSEKFSAPLKNAYEGYYEIPEVMSDSYGLNEFDTVFPVQLKVYEFDRSLTNEETSIISDKSSYPCTNDQAQTIQSLSKIDDVIVRSCDLKATEDQIQQVGNYWLFDQIYNMYIPSRNVFIHIAFDSRYIDNPHEYLSDYITKLLSTNTDIFVGPDQIDSAGELREFEEWRSKTFDQ
ncbi:MAG: hypothetical protein UU81_C0042G0004 [Microgenomates group bacterium GW2011_GWC1_41_8]|uniref:Uncharacterized protein n=3 Tax=Candidatus Roizmaniibacteriota TaxID=1752723 RepID=A0A0G0ZM41_9BACT|nr:MAG: hypothetical protein UU14_C0005G0005 [Candidatus Roizmanbacteria bacterium GW2011_GWB1_40_7]KKR92349.1 MAG: hypothetical protein UU41_C0027G0010 [Candidatus Roizmanbacteria bacterium GW2011_GWA1_41_13]KKS23035.1 MAG: hypothetical protein UU81_C0042G0004 [Microgenomates group bacterium GW2011_GWC1_41_8]KKS23096.1 MAG: hypothetical protein UU78_C0004G0011 [Candidatus Roizmanbacteria bacterium GW2011_GWC2_41_7]